MRHSIKSQISLLRKIIRNKCPKSREMTKKSKTSKSARKVNLISFLNDDDNYQKFSQYLSKCLANENLDFITTIILFRNALLSTLNVNGSLSSNKCLNHLYDLKFKYLRDLEKSFIQKINKNEINEIIEEICNKFIFESSSKSINISWRVRKNLVHFFKCHKQMKIYKNQIEMKLLYLQIFDNAILEIYDCLNVLYTNYCIDNVNNL